MFHAGSGRTWASLSSGVLLVLQAGVVVVLVGCRWAPLSSMRLYTRQVNVVVDVPRAVAVRGCRCRHCRSSGLQMDNVAIVVICAGEYHGHGGCASVVVFVRVVRVMNAIVVVVGGGGECHRSCGGNPAVASRRAGSTVVVVTVVIIIVADCVLVVVVLISLGPSRPERNWVTRLGGE